MNCMVTGVSRGIGRATAAALLRQGHAVWGLSRTAPGDLGSASGERFRHSVCDLGDPESRCRAAEEMDAAGFRPDAVILNAAIEYEEDKPALSWQKIQDLLRINVEGSLFWVSRWLDLQPETSMQFVGVSSLQALRPNADCPAYSASKAALSLAFRSLRLRYAGGPPVFKLLFLGPVHTSIKPRFTAVARRRGVATPESVARHLANVVLPKKGFSFYYPWTTGMIARFGAWMPDPVFERVTRPLRR